MKSRTGAIATLVVSLASLIVTTGLWLGSGPRAIGLDVPLARSGPAEPPRLAGDADRSAVYPREGDETSRLPTPGSVPVRDAGRIQPRGAVEPPRRLRIPSLDVSMPVVPVGVRDDGQMQLPDDPAQIGWYRFGPLPGEARGSVVLAGHVDSVRYGVGPLARLAALREGAALWVIAADGSSQRYRVWRVERIRKTSLPTDRLFDPDSKARLVVITCGGRYLPEAGGYEDNVVVIARPA